MRQQLRILLETASWPTVNGVEAEHAGRADAIKVIPSTAVVTATSIMLVLIIESLGVHLDPETRKPALDPNTLESNVPGIHLAGVVIGGRHTSEIFIENGRFHGKQIIESLKG